MKTTGTPADLPLIHEWLKHEVRDGFGFISNWGMIQKACAEQEMIVFVTNEGPVGFLTRDLAHIHR